MKKISHYIQADGKYIPTTVGNTASKMEAGVYNGRVTMDGTLFFDKISMTLDKIIELPGSITEEVVNDIRNFYSNAVKSKFDDYGLVYKRGILIHGKPGTSKTTTLALIAKIVTEEMDGLVLFNPQVAYLADMVKAIRDIEGDERKIVVLFEEFDSVLSRSEDTMLSVMDGELQVANIVYLATTNYISRIPSRIKNRPSRFARVIEMGELNEDARRAFFTAKLKGEDIQHLEALVQASEGFVIDQMKDLIISVCCFNIPSHEAVMKIKEMNESYNTGIDDYNEENASSIFKSNKSFTSKNPLKPL